MGGNSFNNANLVVPRMPPKVYKEVLQKVEKSLSDLFETVTHMIEGPEKTSYGDLDLLVLPHSGVQRPHGQLVADRIGAGKWFEAQKGILLQFAIPWPDEYQDISLPASNKRQPLPEIEPQLISNLTVSESSEVVVKSPESPVRYTQLDLNICATSQLLRWSLFKSAHADFAHIVSTIIRPRGLTLNDEAFYVRIASVEKHNKKAARIELSRNPEQVLKYLGLDPTRYWQPFNTLDEMMNYVAKCRFFNPADFQVDNTDPVEVPDPTFDKLIKARVKTRPILDYWFKTFLPSQQNKSPKESALLTRDQVLEDVFTFFGKNIKTTYEAQKVKADIDMARQTLWPSIRAEIHDQNANMTDEDLEDTMKAIRKVIQKHIPRTQDDKYYVVRQAYRADEMTTVKAWAVKYHANVLLAYRAGELDYQPRNPDQPQRRPSTFSSHGVETYTAEDDEVILRMKEDENVTWTQILQVLGKKSKSQLQNHWKKDLEGRGGDRDAIVN